MVEAIFYVLRTAVAWRDLPACFGPWNSVYTRWRRWCAVGLWQEILRLLSRRAEGRVRFIDGSHVKCHQFATNPAGGQSAQAIGRTKGGLNTKICALVEGGGRLMAVAIAPGQTYEVEAAAPLLETLRRVLLVGDKGFDSDALRCQMLAQGCLASIPPRSGRRAPAWFHQGFYRQRYRIENFFQRIKIYKRIATRYDKLALTFLNFVLLAAILDWLKSFSKVLTPKIAGRA
jgi:transposase